MTDGTGFDAALRRWPWPEDAVLDGIAPFDWSLDGGGRSLIQQVIDRRPFGVLLEIGSFMGGATRAWLRANPALRCICVDPWGDNLIVYARNLLNADWALKSYGPEAIERYATLLETYGTMKVVRNNLAEFRARCVMVQLGVPEVFPALREIGVRPDIVFLDALKRRDEFRGAHEAFPDAILTGDDWSWADAEGNYPVRAFAAELARARNAQIYARRATFVIAEPRHGPSYDPGCLFTPPES